MQVLRLDGAGPTRCSYTEAQLAGPASRFDAELSVYNAVPNTTLVSAFGVSPFMPRARLTRTGNLLYMGVGVRTVRQPGELWVAVESTTGSSLISMHRLMVHTQRRNVMGVMSSVSGGLRIERMQQSAAPEAAISPFHFRLLFSHAALSMPNATVVANDDIELMSVAVGSFAAFDHPLVAPHQAAQLLKLSFIMPGITASTHIRIDLSTLCEGAAYAIVLVGTLSHLDLFDPVLMRIDGTSSACSLPASVVDAGASSSLAMLNVEPSTEAVRIEWGPSLLALNYRTAVLGFGAVTIADVAVGNIFARVLSTQPPYVPLSPIYCVTIHNQARNVLLLKRSTGDSGGGGGGGSASCGFVSSRSASALRWRVADEGSSRAQVAASTVRLLVINELRARSGTVSTSTSTSATLPGLTARALLSSALLFNASASLPAGGSTEVVLPQAGGATVRFSQVMDQSRALGRPAVLNDGVACAQSLQLVVLIGSASPSAPAPPPLPPARPPGVSAPPPTDLYAPRLVHVDVADGYCRLVIPQIPQRVNPPAPASSPPRQQATLDIFGEGGPGDGGMLSAAPPGGRHRAGMASMLLALTLAAVAGRLVRC